MNHRRIIIGALSARQYPERRRRCRETWFDDAALFPELEPLFLIGAEGEVRQPTLIDDLLLLPCPNDYQSLPQRTRWFCQWAIEARDFDYLFKCDDDTFLCIERLLAFDTWGRDYIGAEWRPGVDYASGGAGYLLSRRAAEIVAKKLDASTGAEDKLVGDVLRAAGIGLAIDNRFVPYGNATLRPTRGNDLITAHAMSGDLARQSHRETSCRWPFRIVMPVTQDGTDAWRASLALLDRCWPGHPEVDLLTGSSPATMAGVRKIQLGDEAALSWTGRLREYLERYHRDQFLLLLTDDKGLAAPCETGPFRSAVETMARTPEINVVYLGWHPAAPKRQLGHLLVLPKQENCVSTQAAIWRRDRLLRLLQVCGDADVATFEKQASDWTFDFGALDELFCQVDLREPLSSST
jgi:hypothetical protein